MGGGIKKRLIFFDVQKYEIQISVSVNKALLEHRYICSLMYYLAALCYNRRVEIFAGGCMALKDKNIYYLYRKSLLTPAQYHAASYR